MTEKLRERASKSEPDKADFSSLADQVEEFTLRFLEPLKYENLPIRRFFSVNPELNVILETAIKLKQKKVTFDYFRSLIKFSLISEKMKQVFLCVNLFVETLFLPIITSLLEVHFS